MDNDYAIIDTVPADSFEPGDQAIIEDELVIIRKIDSDREDIDEILVYVENLTDPTNTEIPLYADDYYDLWSL